MATTTYSGENVVDAVTGTTPTYNYEDPYGAYDLISQNIGLTDATGKVQTAQQALTDYQEQAQATVNALRANRNLSTGLEAGFEAQRTREATAQEQVLANELALAQSAQQALQSQASRYYDVYQQERATRENLLLQAIQAGAKNVNIGMTTTELTNALTTAQKEAEKKAAKEAEEAEKKAYKDQLKQTLRSLGISTSGLSKNELEKKLEKYYASESEYEAKIKQLELASKQKSLSSSGTKEVTLDLSDTGISKMIDEEINAGTSWNKIASDLELAGISTASGGIADRYLRYKFLGESNPFE